MSKFIDSLKRQVGRDSGKAISNFILGDSHSTPHRNINSQNRIISDNVNQKKLEFLHQDLKQKDLYLLDGAVINSVNYVIGIEIPNNEKDIIKILQELEIQLKVNKWLPVQKGEIAKIRNKFPDSVLTKYEHCLNELKYVECNEERLILASKTLSKYKKLRFLYKYQLFIICFCILFLIFLVVITH